MKSYIQMDADTQRKVFWLLKRLTSYRLWQRKKEAWEKFAVTYEEAITKWPAGEAEKLPADNLPRIYEISSCYNAGLMDLRRGNRFVWRNGGALERAIREYWAVSAYIYPDGDYWERGIQEAPYPPKIEALSNLMRASEFRGEEAPLESLGSSNEPALIESPAWLLDPMAYRHRFYALQYPTFPEILPEIPIGTTVVVKSGEKIPVDGIWEPVNMQKSRMFGFLPAGEAEIDCNGCFNYFVHGVKAPRISGRGRRVDDRAVAVSTHWRLIWEDDRYKDGIIPDESEYFIDPTPAVAPVEGEVAREYRTHEICPVSGLWQAVGYKNPPIHIAAGTVMPDLSVRDVKGDMVLHYVKWQLVKRG